MMRMSSLNVNVIWSSIVLLLLLTLKPSTTNAIRILPTDFTRRTSNNATNLARNLAGSGQKVDVPVPNGPDDHLVHEMPLLDNAKFPTKHWAGLLPSSDDGHKYFFYWLFAPPENTNVNDDDIPLLVWLNGGPACSSMDGLWLENGPFRLTQDDHGQWTIDIDEFSWHNSPAYVVYIDQPVGTGLSFTTNRQYPRNDQEVNIDFYYFLQELLKLHANKFVDTATNTVKRPLYFSGESHAGHYIPSMMNYIHKQNLKSDANQIQIPLSGGAIGNGWFDPPHQYSAHQVAYGYGMIGLSQLRSLEEKERQCQQDLANGNYVSGVCFDLLNYVVDNSAGHGSKYKASQYDQRVWEVAHQPRDFPPGHQDVESLLGASSYNDALKALTPSMLEAIHATPSWESGQRYRECTDPPYNALKHQDGLGVQNDVIELLNANIRLMFFNGIHDLICNHVGNEVALENLNWDGNSHYLMAKRYGWESKTTNKLGGYIKEYPPLSFLKVLDSGHMVPMDVPEISLEMMTTFMYQQSFETHEQQLGRKADENKDNCPICPAPDNNNNNEPAACPVCEDCPSSSSSSTPAETQKGSKDIQPSGDNTIEVPLAYVGAASVTIGLLLLILLGLLCYCCYCSSRRGLGFNPRRSKGAPQFDLELPRNGGYADNNGYRDEYYDDKVSEREMS